METYIALMEFDRDECHELYKSGSIFAQFVYSCHSFYKKPIFRAMMKMHFGLQAGMPALPGGILEADAMSYAQTR